MYGLRRKINLFVFENRVRVRRIMGVLVALSSIAMVASMVFYHGFSHTEERKQLLLEINRIFFGVFILNFLVRSLLAPNWKAFIKGSWLEATLLSLVVVNFISLQLFNFGFIAAFFTLLDWDGFTPYYVFFIQCYLLVLILLEIIKSVHNLGRIRLRPTTIFIFSFLLLIFAGAGMLMLPAMSPVGNIRFIDAMFTSTSASCVTGLVVVDTATFFNTKGQLVVLFLIQLGGLGIISFATFFATFLKKGVGLHQQSMLKSLLDNESLTGTVSLLRKVIFYTIIIELMSSILIYFFWGNHPFESTGQRVYYSVFHAIAAFCNAGFSLFSGNLMDPAVYNNYMLHLCVAVTIFFGSLGFPAIRDIFEVKNVRERLSKPWKRWKLSTQIAFYTSLLLVAFGALMFYLLEKDGVMKGLTTMPVLVTSIFQSVTTRTAGFNSVDFSLLGAPILIIFILLMFIGASSGSTGGGIKTSTFVVIYTAILSTVSGKNNVTMGRRSISQELIYKAFAVFIFSATFTFVAVVLLVIAEPGMPVIDLIFEEVSAFSTTGLSTGITPRLSDFSKWVLIVSMFVGRVGVLSLAFSLSVSVKANSYRYPNSHIMIG